VSQEQQSRSRLVAVARSFGCAAAVMLGCAVVLGLRSLFGASETVFGAPANGEQYSRWDSRTANYIVWWSVGGAALVFVGVVAALRGRRWSSTLVLALGVGIGILASSVLYRGGLFHTYAVLSTKFAPSQALPTAMAAWVLTVVGCFTVVLISWPLLGRGPASRREFTVGAGIGIVAVLAIGWPFAVAANPGRNFEATTSDDVQPRELPATVGGTPQFTLKLDNADWNINGDIGYALRAAGPGFVVREHDGVRAYDPAGHERWHFRHTGGWRLADFRVFDAAATVLLMFSSGETRESGEAISLDASTGRQLWRSADPALIATLARFAAGWARPGQVPLYLTVQRGQQLDRIDTRTGRRSWTVTVPKDYEPLDTESGVGYFTGKTSGDRAELHYVSLKPDTGAIRFDALVSSYSVKAVPDRDSPNSFADTAVFAPTHAGRNGIVFEDRIGRRFYLNAQTGAVVTPLDGSVMFRTVATDDFIAQALTRDSPDTLRSAPDGKTRCTLPEESLVPPTAWLRDEALSITGNALTAYRRSDCAVVAQPGPVNASDVVPAPGVLLVVELQRGGGTTITGYA
jgi:hypothetical protein